MKSFTGRIYSETFQSRTNRPDFFVLPLPLHPLFFLLSFAFTSKEIFAAGRCTAPLLKFTLVFKTVKINLSNPYQVFIDTWGSLLCILYAMARWLLPLTSAYSIFRHSSLLMLQPMLQENPLPEWLMRMSRRLYVHFICPSYCRVCANY